MKRFLLDTNHFGEAIGRDRKSTRLNSSHDQISYAVFCLKKKKTRNSSRLAQNDKRHQACQEDRPYDRLGSKKGRRASHEDRAPTTRGRIRRPTLSHEDAR